MVAKRPLPMRSGKYSRWPDWPAFAVWGMLALPNGLIAGQPSIYAKQSAVVDSSDEASQLLAQSCTGCHRDTPHPPSTIPPINDLAPAALEQFLIDFKQGNRSGTIMSRIARGYSDREIHLLANSYAELRSD